MILLILNFTFWFLTFYFLIGFFFACYFVFRKIGEVDPLAKEGTWGFRLFMIPGVMIFWPLFLWRWQRGRKEPPIERGAHRDFVSKKGGRA